MPSAAYDEPEYGTEVDWAALRAGDPVQADRVLLEYERQLDVALRAALDSGFVPDIEEEGCSSLSTIFRLVHSEDEEERVAGIGFLVRRIEREHKFALLEIADDLGLYARALVREHGDDRYGSPEDVVRRHVAVLDSLRRRLREAARR